jgi:hypothetical protein
MDNNIYIILAITFLILFLIGIGFTLKNILFYKYQYFIISIALTILFFFLIYMTIFYSYPKNMYLVNTNPCPDFWELQKDGTCKINPNNIGSMPMTQKSHFIPDNSPYPVYCISTDYIPFGYDQLKNPYYVDFKHNQWSTYSGSTSRICALKAWANKNNVVWDGIHNYNHC